MSEKSQADQADEDKRSYQAIYHSARTFMHKMHHGEVTRRAYREHLKSLSQEIGIQLIRVSEKEPCKPPSKKTSS